MQLINDFIYTAAYPMTLIVLLLIGLLLLPWSRVSTVLRSFYITLMILSVPYGCLVWLASITADLYDNPIHKLNLFLILLFDALIPSVMLSYLKQVKTSRFNSKAWLYSPLSVLIGSLSCFFYLLLTK